MDAPSLRCVKRSSLNVGGRIVSDTRDSLSVSPETGRQGGKTLVDPDVRKIVTAVDHNLSCERERQIRLDSAMTSRRSVSPNAGARCVKRALDVFLSGLGLVLSGPLWAVIGLVIRLEDGGPVFYSQERVGKGGCRFRSWKFRSMVPDSDGKFGPLQASENDQRVTLVGRVLRAAALDELPQLWNIFTGDMSFVGPRALLPAEIEVNGKRELVPIEQVPGYWERHSVRPGLTGMAQVYAPRDVPRRHKFKYDLIYIQNQSFWLDLKLIALSFWITFRGKWESRSKKF